MTPYALAKLHAKCFQTPRPWTEKEFSELLANPQYFLNSAPNGFALGRLAGPEAELITLAVDPAARRQGIGFALVSEFIETAKTAGAVEVFLEVVTDNTAAIGLYERLGFSKAGIRKSYYNGPKGQRIDALVLTKSLSNP